MDPFDRFLQERTYLKNVSPETLRYYRWVHRAFQPILAEPTKAGMLDCIQKLLADGVSPISVNTYLRGFKAYLRWPFKKYVRVVSKMVGYIAGGVFVIAPVWSFNGLVWMVGAMVAGLACIFSHKWAEPDEDPGPH